MAGSVIGHGISRAMFGGVSHEGKAEVEYRGADAGELEVDRASSKPVAPLTIARAASWPEAD